MRYAYASSSRRFEQRLKQNHETQVMHETTCLVQKLGSYYDHPFWLTRPVALPGQIPNF